MEAFEFAVLEWLKLSDAIAAKAAAWYKGPGWYYNLKDREGKVLEAICAGKSDTTLPVPFSGQVEALNHCGAEGWFVAAYVPATQDLVGRFSTALGSVLSGHDLAPQPFFILQRRCRESGR
jgi:hypothetical protein